VGVFDNNGATLGSFGNPGSSAAALDGLGTVYTVEPGDASSTFRLFDASQNLLSSFVFSTGIDNGNGSPDYITDLAWGGNGTLWASGFNGVIYHLNLSGTVLSSFDTGVLDTGIATDGVHLYTTSGSSLFNNPASIIYQRDFSGSILNSIDTGLPDTLGLGFDTSDGSFWVGGVDQFSHVSASGAILNTFQADGFHTGLEIGDIGSTPTAVPESSSMMLLGGGLLVMFVARAGGIRRLLLSITALASALHGAVSAPSLTPSLLSPQPVGTLVTWTVTATDTDPGTLFYRFRISDSGGPFRTVVDFGPSNIFEWTPNRHEGNFSIEVTVRNLSTASSMAATAAYTISTRVTGGSAVSSTTDNPLVALYSAPECAAGSSMRVRFKRPSDVFYQSTALQACATGLSMNFLIAGMYPSSTYEMRHDIVTGPRVATVSGVTFTTGASTFSPTIISATQPQSPTSTSAPIMLFSPLTLGSSTSTPFATDLNGNLLWYYQHHGQTPQNLFYLTRPAPGGNMIVTLRGSHGDLAHAGFREIDLAGSTIAETNVRRLNEQLSAAGMHTINLVHHDARRLANGNYLMLGMEERILDVQGPQLDIVGDMILVLDSNLQLLWAWDAFDHLDLTRQAVLNEHCGTDCELLLANTANDWTHGNDVALAPDGNLIYSSRHQDFVFKINYANGTGNGSVIWRLGNTGDFTMLTPGPFPWFSHQHDAEYESNNQISLYDNGNTRVAQLGGNSRGQVLQLDEVNHTAQLVLNADLGVFSQALGSAQLLSNGNHTFTSGITPATNTELPEVNPAGTIVYKLARMSATYRSFRLRDLYSAPW
jgi:hypothetical protein